MELNSPELGARATDAVDVAVAAAGTTDGPAADTAVNPAAAPRVPGGAGVSPGFNGNPLALKS